MPTEPRDPEGSPDVEDREPRAGKRDLLPLSWPSRSRHVRSRVPPAATWLAIVAAIAVGVLVQILEIPGDNAVTNVVTFVCTIVALMILGIWFVISSGYSRKLRRLVGFLAFATIAAAFIAFRIDNVSGELVPSIRWRWSKKADELLSRPVAESEMPTVDAVNSEAEAFPQFLGPNRSARVDGIELNRDWAANPPRELWRQPIGAGWSAFAVSLQRAVTLEQRGPEEFVTCYDLATGRLLWAVGTPTRHESILGGVGPRSTPTIHNGRVFTLGATGELLCIELGSGNVVWRDNLLERCGVAAGQDEQAVAWGRAGSPLIVDELVVVPAGGPVNGVKVSLAAFHQATGKLAWESGTSQVSYSSPALATLAGVRQVISVNESDVSGHDTQTGTVLWSAPWKGSSTGEANCSQPVPVGKDHLLLSKGYGWGAALLQLTRREDGKLEAVERWRSNSVLKTKFTNVVLNQNHAYGLSDGTLECVEVATGQRRWKRGRYGQGQILGVGGVLLVQAESGDVAMVEAQPEEFRELGRFNAIDGKTWNNLCLAGKRLLVRNAEEAACYELP